MAKPRRLKPTVLVIRGLRRRCPLCGARGIFASWFRQVDRCPTCNFPTTRVDDQWIGALGMNTIASFTSLVVAIAIGFAATYPDPPVATLMIVMLAVAVIVPVGFYPISKSLWSAIDLAMRPPEPDDDVDVDYL